MFDVRRLVHRGVAEGALRYELLRPILGDPVAYEGCRARLAREVQRAGIGLYPDLEESPTGPSDSPPIEPDPRFPSDSLQVYLREVRRFSPMGRDEEAAFARAFEVARDVLALDISAAISRGENPALLRDLGSDPLLLDALRARPLRLAARGKPRGPGRDLPRSLDPIRRRLADARRVRSLFVARNLQLVPLFARRYRKLGVPPLDLIQEGNAALFRAAEKFDWRRGVRFSTYAQWWIQQAILKCLYSQSRVVRLPVYLGQKLKRLNEARGDFYGRSGRHLTPEELSESLDEPLARIRRALRSSAPVVSLDRDREEESPLSERLPDPRAPEVRDEPPGPSLRLRLEALLALLSERERKILRLRYGLGGVRPCTLDEVSGLFSVSRERVRQIQVRALERLRAQAERGRLAAFLG